MAPLAGRPPFATDEPDSVYDAPAAPRPRMRQPAPEDPNKRTSAYDVYNNYVGGDKGALEAPATTTNRNSGIGAMLLAMGDDSDSDDDDEDYRRRPTKPPGISTSPSKNAKLAAAVSVPSAPRPSAPEQVPAALVSGAAQPKARQENPFQPQQQQQQPQPPAMMRGPPPPGPGPVAPMQQHQQQMQNNHIAAPRPGYPAPIAALNLARPEMTASPAGRQLTPGAPMQMPSPQHPQQQQRGPPMPAPIRIPGPMDPPHRGAFTSSPTPSSPAPSTPHPLHPPVTPITPAFIRPSKSPVPGTVVNVSFQEGVATPRKPIIRGNSEETLLPSRGEKGDDFWRRFSMVVKEESKKHPKAKESPWLKKTRAGLEGHSRRVWVIGVILIILIAGGIGCGVYFTRNNNSHEVPTAIGGGADFTSGVATSTSATGKAGNKSTTSSSRHVSPTNTINDRRGYEFGPAGLKNRQDNVWEDAAPPAITPAPTPAAGAGNASATVAPVPALVRRHKKRLNSGLGSW